MNKQFLYLLIPTVVIIIITVISMRWSLNKQESLQNKPDPYCQTFADTTLANLPAKCLGYFRNAQGEE